MFNKITIFLHLFICFFISAQQVTTLNGFGGGGYVDGPLATARFNSPWALCTDSTGNIIYVADTFNNKIRKIDLINNTVTTIAGSTQGYLDGSLLTAQFNLPRGVCMDSNGNLFVADDSNHKIRKIDLSTGMVSTFAGSTQGYANGLGANAQFNEPNGICIDSSNNLFVSEYQGHRIRKITPAGQVSNLAGNGTASFADGIGSNAKFFSPNGLCVDSQNNIYVADSFNAKIRKITGSTVTTIAGSTPGYLDGSALQAKFLTLDGICIDNNDNLYVVDNNAQIRKLYLTTNMVSTFINSNPPSDPTGIYYINNLIYFTEVGGCKIKKIADVLATENFEQNLIKLYPNPNNGSFKINIYTNFKIEIYDILGQLVYNKVEIQSENTIETGLKKGIYFVKLITEEGKIATQKMVVD